MRSNEAVLEMLNNVAEYNDKAFLAKMYKTLYEYEAVNISDEGIIFDVIKMYDDTMLYSLRMGDNATLFVEYEGKYPEKLYQRDRYEGMHMSMEDFWEKHFPKPDWLKVHGPNMPRGIIGFETYDYIPQEFQIKLLEKYFISAGHDGVYPMMFAMSEYIYKEGIDVLKEMTSRWIEGGDIRNIILMMTALPPTLKNQYKSLLVNKLQFDKKELGKAIIKEYYFYNHTYRENNEMLKGVMVQLGLPAEEYPEPKRGWAGSYDIVVQYEPSYIQCECKEISPYSGNECNCPFCGSAFYFRYEFL